MKHPSYPNIVVLDSVGVNLGDLSWDSLRSLGNVTIYDQSSQEQVTLRAKEADIICVNRTRLSAASLAACPRLRCIALFSTGYNQVDVAAADQLGITVCNVPGYSTAAVSQHAIALMLGISNFVETQDAFCRQQAAPLPAAEMDALLLRMVEWEGKTMGIVGYGQIGRRTGQIARALGMKVLAYARHPVADYQNQGECQYVSLEALLQAADVVSLHLPLTEDTQGIIHAKTLALMKPSAVLINTARGALVDEQALAAALQAGRLKAAGLDVLEQEPMRPDNPLFGLKNVLYTPHTAWAPHESRKRLLDITIENLQAFLLGRAQHVVNHPQTRTADETSMNPDV